MIRINEDVQDARVSLTEDVQEGRFTITEDVAAPPLGRLVFDWRRIDTTISAAVISQQQ